MGDPAEGPSWVLNGSNAGLRWAPTPTEFRTTQPFVSLRVRAINAVDSGGIENAFTSNAGVAFETGISFSWAHTNASFQQAWYFKNTDYFTNAYSPSLVADTWYHLGNYNASSSDWRIYLNGALDGSSNPTEVPDPDRSVSVVIGGLDNGSGIVSVFDGRVTDLRTYDPAVVGSYADELMRVIHDPATKWDLFHELGRRQSYFSSTGVVDFQPIIMVT